MQQGYGGGVSEFQQFMVDASSLFSISSGTPQAAPPLAPPAPPLSAPVAVSSLQPHYSHFHSHIPFTQQLFQQHHHSQNHHVHHHFQLFNPTPHTQQDHHERTRLMVHQQLGLDPESGPENSGGGGGPSAGSGGGGTHAAPSFFNVAMGFKLAVDTGTSGGGTGEDDVILPGGGSGAGEEESAIKEPSWRPLDIDFISSNNKRCKEKEPDAAPSSPQQPPAKYFKKGSEAGNGNNYKLFSELEAIYKPGSSSGFADCSVAGGTGSAGGNTAGGSGGDGVDCTGTGMGNQTGAGSGSGLTGDENPLINEPVGLGDISMAPTATETSAGEEATPVKKASKSGGEGRRKRRRQRRLSSLAAFFERLVRQLVDHQEALHNRFLESMERREQERASREESWRLQEAAKAAREATARAQERALASAREAAIVSFLEKITGETINLPTNPDIDMTGTAADANNMLSTHVVDMSENQDLGNVHAGSGLGFSTSRWPKTEVQALIRVRSGLEARFQEPGLKGPLWEEVSMRMTALGYRRSAKRCKEKWENINKYFRKAKESGKKRPQHSKTCPYFHQLDQLYSKSSSYMYSPSSPSVNPTGDTEVAKGGGSELLDAVVLPLDQMGSSREFEREGDDGEEEEEEEEEERHEEREEGEGESHGHGQEVVDQRTNESSLFF
ncbi:Trihelix transcription factor GT-2 [Rhynchospora pubera]|uniref:Trihelix transcription factor GT-2 n=1 Tax=Rhynchospora pubera TaxID=906938 RepID=A0AAV8GNY3_9POAL|nr:Trihelix transcription factor GT-2 [Rhynchospora pubera]